MDFTLAAYRRLLEVLVEYRWFTVADWLRGGDHKAGVVMRHDIDRWPENAVPMAKLEAQLGLRASYYFRFPYTFDEAVVRDVHALGHEVGYHYETMAKAKGDPAKAIALFGEELAHMRRVVDVETACFHGSPLARMGNAAIWEHASPAQFGLLGEAFSDLDSIPYFSDTGRTWGKGTKMRDRTSGSRLDLRTTADLIRHVKDERPARLHLLVHPERWNGGAARWTASWFRDVTFNTGKRALMLARGRSR